MANVVGTPVDEDLPVTEAVAVDAQPPTVLDIKILPKVYATIQKYGKGVKIDSRTRDEYDPTTGAAPLSEETVYDTLTNDKPLKVSPPATYDQKYIDGNNVQTGDCYVLLPTLYLPMELNVTNVLDMKVKIDGVFWSIVRARPILSGEQIAVWDLQLRR